MGCFWRNYPRQATIHVELLLAMAHKGVDLVAEGRLTPESMPELTYPLERASAFVDLATRRAGAAIPPSLAALRGLCERYRALLDTLDVVRREERGEGARSHLAQPLADVDASGAAVRRALATEAGELGRR